MWNGDQDAEASHRLSIEMAIAQHTGASPASVASARPAMWNGEHSGSVSYSNAPSQSAEEESDDDDDDDDEEDMQSSQHSKTSNVYEDEDDGSRSNPSVDFPSPTQMNLEGIQSRGKPEAIAAKLASQQSSQVEKVAESQPEAESKGGSGADGSSSAAATTTPPKAAKVKSSKTPAKKKKAPTKKKIKMINPAIQTMDDPVVPVTDAQFGNLTTMMIQFCRVPLLAEFSRPVSLLHPELMGVYGKIVECPVDLGSVCRKIRRKSYSSIRDVRLDVWRIFSNCMRYHCHPTNKDAVPSLVSIALHLRDFFNDLWQEYMVPSDPPSPSAPAPTKKGYSPLMEQRLVFEKRKTERKKRMVVSGLSVMTGKSLDRAAVSLEKLINGGGKVDALDQQSVWGPDAENEHPDLATVVGNLRVLQSRIKAIAATEEEFGLDELDGDVRRCYSQDVLENSAALQLKIAYRLDRWLGKIVVPIHEATCRGVSQSSIWGCMAAAVWARESSKKPFWPALVLGIMAPAEQREDWHLALTERNENRLPEKLKTQLGGGKRRFEAAIKKQSLGQMDPQSYFLVEFLGTHEFIWVREADLVEGFDAEKDPNQDPSLTAGKKKRASRSNVANIIGTKLYAAAVEEGKWAVEEFEVQLQDVGGDTIDDEEDGEEGYSYTVLCQSDDEVDPLPTGNEANTPDIDECNELLATNGSIDFTQAGRRSAKKKAQLEKKRKADEAKKLKADKTKKQKELSKKRKDAKDKEKAVKLEQKELDRKRKKRVRDREKALKGSDKKQKMSDVDRLSATAVGRRAAITGKRERATAIVEGYIGRSVDNAQYQTLCLNGTTTVPANAIDSTGLFGMALAFRAAAGDIRMPPDSDENQPGLKPWDAVDVDSLKAEEREAALRRRIDLLTKGIAKVKTATSARKSRLQSAEERIKARQLQVITNDETARQNPLKKKKIVTSGEKKSEKTQQPENSEKQVGAGSPSNGTTNGTSVPAQMDVEPMVADAPSNHNTTVLTNKAKEEIDDTQNSNKTQEPAKAEFLLGS